MLEEMKNARDYFSKFDAAVKNRGNELVNEILSHFPELELHVKNNLPFFKLRSNNWSIFSLLYQTNGFKLTFVNDAAFEFNATGVYELLGSEKTQSLFFNPDNKTQMRHVIDMIGRAIIIQTGRPWSSIKH